MHQLPMTNRPRNDEPGRLKIARDRMGLTQKELGDLVELDQQTVWRHENGRLPIRDKSRRAYASALNISVVWLQHGLGDGPELDASRLLARYLASDYALDGVHPEVVELLRRFPYASLGLTQIGLRQMDDLRRIMETNRGAIGHSAHAAQTAPADRQAELFDDSPRRTA